MVPIAEFLAAVLLYELFRWRILGLLRERWQRSISQFLRRHGVALEHFRFIDRLWVRETLLQDPELGKYAAEVAARGGTTMADVRRRIERYLDEIVPYFNIFSYYKLGAAAARAATRFCYELVFDEPGLEAARAQVPDGAVVVYVANHRSNADYVVLSVGALRQVALSYAVGEWALVWPLDVLFRSFGSYFVRRGEKDPLYHAVLERYLQLVASRGLTTAFFLEGGLSRDGALRVPRVGLLDYLIGILRSEPDRVIVFLPVGINYDRVLEDRNLLGSAKAPGIGGKLLSMLGLLLRFPVLVAAVFTRAALRSHRKYGYAAVDFGPPVRLSELLPDPVAVANLPRRERLPQVAVLADALLDRVAATIPATPIPLVCRALLSGARDLGDVRRATREEIVVARAVGRPLAFGVACAGVRHAQRHLGGEQGDKAHLDADVTAAEEAERTVDLARLLMRRRRLVQIRGGRVVVPEASLPLLSYYARSLDPPAHRAGERAGG